MQVNYIIQAHRGAEQLGRLIKRLNGPDVFFYVHIDKSVDIKQFKDPFQDFKNVNFLVGLERVSTPWSNIGCVKASLIALKSCVENTLSKGYCVLLSGQDYPLRSNKYIMNFFAENYGKNFIDIADIADMWPMWKVRYERYNFHLPKKRTEMGLYPYTDSRFYSVSNAKNLVSVSINFGIRRTLETVLHPKRKRPSSLSLKGGSAWWAFPIETIGQILDYLEQHPEILPYHEFTHVPDETFFHSIVHAIKPTSEIRKSVTYVNWERKDVILPVTFQTADDLRELMALDDIFLFARKFETSQNCKILDDLDAAIHNTTFW